MYQGKIVELGPTEIVVERSGASVYPGADEFGAGAGTGVRQYQNRGHEHFRPLPLRRTGGDSLMTEEILQRRAHRQDVRPRQEPGPGGQGCLIRPGKGPGHPHRGRERFR